MDGAKDHGADRLTPSAYGRLIEDMLEPAAGYALSILRNRADAEDAVQQAALLGLQRLSHYDPGRPFRAWWFVVLRHCCVDLLRRRRPHASLDHAASAVARRDEAEDWQGLAEAIERLEPQHADILRLRYFAGLSYDELRNGAGITSRNHGGLKLNREACAVR